MSNPSAVLKTGERTVPQLSPSLALAVIDTISIPILVLDLDLRIVEANRAFCAEFRLQRFRLIGEPIAGLGERWNAPALRGLLEDFMLGRGTLRGCDIGCEIAELGSRALLLDARMTTAMDNEFQTRILLTLRDVTAERTLARQRDDEVRRKETLLEEMSHRVINSLTIISALLQFKSKSAEQPETRAALLEIQHRIMSIAAVQQLLLVPAHGRTVSLDLLLRNLCENLAASMVQPGQAIAVRVRVGDAVVDSADAVSIGLVVTELVINALKHAFPRQRKEGGILVTYQTTPTGWALAVSDNGIGVHHHAPPASRRGLGTFIIQALARQLNAEVDVRLQDGRTTTLAGSTRKAAGESSTWPLSENQDDLFVKSA